MYRLAFGILFFFMFSLKILAKKSDYRLKKMKELFFKLNILSIGSFLKIIIQFSNYVTPIIFFNYHQKTHSLNYNQIYA